MKSIIKSLQYPLSGLFFLAELFILLFISSCCNTVPRITTSQVTDIERNSAVCGGNVTDDGGGNCDCSDRGVCWSTNPSPTIADSRTSDGAGIGSFTSSLTQLTANTLYYVRAYATNAQGTSYGNEASFTSKDIMAPTVTTSPVSSVTTNSAVSGGTITDDGGTAITAKGVCWATTENPDVTKNKTDNGAGPESFTSNITGLQPGTTYHVRAYSINIKGTSYGQDVPFGTTCSAPSATTNSPTEVTSTSAKLNGTVNANGTTCTTQVIFEYGTTTSYGSTIAATPGTVTGTSNTSVSAALTGLTPGQIYHYRVKATSSGGTTTGSDQTINPTCPVPSATTNPADPVGTTTATLKGTVNANNCSTTVTFEYGETTSYGSTIAASPGTVTGTTNTSVSATISGLTPCKLYHYRVKTVNSGGTTNGSDQSFTTIGTAPTATTSPATPIGTTTSTLRGTVNANNSSATVTFEYGITTSYGTTVAASPSPVTGNSTTSVSAALTGLIPNKQYNYRVKAVNCGGTSYGSNEPFTTSCLAPSPILGSASVGYTAAILYGSVNANNASTTVTFEYGKTTSLGSSATAVQSPVTGTTSTSVNTSTITGLEDNTLYYYRIKAVNCGGTSYTGIGSFKTNAPYPTSGLVSYFKFDGNLKDFLSNTPEGTYHGSAGFTTGIAGYALYLNGTNAYVDFARDSYKSGNNVSVAFWLKKSNTSEDLKYFMTCSDFGMWTRTGEVGIAISLPSTNSASGVIAANTWVHVVGTYDGANIRIYINGVLKETTYHPGSISDPNWNLSIGYSYVYWAGIIDDLFIYNKTLNQSEVTQIYNYH